MVGGGHRIRTGKKPVRFRPPRGGIRGVWSVLGGIEPMRELGGGSVLHSWRALFGAGPVAGLEDGPLLERFADLESDGDSAEAAFAALVARHGPMVHRVCRRLLGDPNDADDAFQATFLVLARKARGIQRPERLASWLYGTAHRASRRLRADLVRRRRHEAGRPGPTSEATRIGPKRPRSSSMRSPSFHKTAGSRWCSATWRV